jgi:hypothetical protein
MTKLSHEDEFLQQMMGNDDSYNFNATPIPAPSPQRHQHQQQRPQLKQLQVLLKSDSRLNDKLLDFFKRNLKKINSCGYIFEWIVVYEDEIEYYESQDINKFPALILEDGVAFGLNEIKMSLNELVNPKVKHVHVNRNDNQPRRNDQNNHGNHGSQRQNNPSESTGDVFRDYLMNDINKNGEKCDEVNENDDFTNSIQRRMTAFSKTRKELETKTNKKNVNLNGNGNTYDDEDGNDNVNHRSGGRQNGGDSSNVMDIVKQVNKGSQEDDMMTKFWANQEESEY